MSEIVTKKRSWAGIIVSAIPILFLLMDAVGKLVKPEPVVTGTIELGYSESVIIPLGVVLLICAILYAMPKTAVLGAILLTGYLGGAWRHMCGLIIHCSRTRCFPSTWES